MSRNSDSGQRGTKVSVYVPCHNYGRYLSQAVESVLQQVYINWELFLIDEGSDDDTREIIEHYEARFPEKIFGIYHDEALGLQKTANEVLGCCGGDYLIRLDADDWLDENALLLLASRLSFDQSLKLVFGDYYLVDEAGKIISIESTEKSGSINLSYMPAHGACTMFRVRDVKAVGGYDESVDAQDGWDLWFKLVESAQAVRIRVPVFYYRQHGASLSRDNSRLLDARRKLIRSTGQYAGDYAPSVLAVVGAKESYGNALDVPFQKLGNKCLLRHVIESLGQSTCISAIAVSSSSTRVIDSVKNLADQNLIAKPLISDHRDQPDSEGFVPIDEILMGAVARYYDRSGSNPDIVLFCSLHSVNRTGSHVDDAVNVLRLTRQDSIVSVVEERDLIFKHVDDGLSVLNPGRIQGIRKERERLFRYNGAIMAVWFDVLQTGSLLGEKIGFFEMTRQESAIFTMRD